jgi:hypothetical protein
MIGIMTGHNTIRKRCPDTNKKAPELDQEPGSSGQEKISSPFRE